MLQDNDKKSKKKKFNRQLLRAQVANLWKYQNPA